MPTSILTPNVMLFGDVEHPDFADAVGLLGRSACLHVNAGTSMGNGSAEHSAGSVDLFVMAQSRPGLISPHELAQISQQRADAAIVVLLGTWCEGQQRHPRSSAAWEDVYWHTFPAWWRQYLRNRPLVSTVDERPSTGTSGTSPRSARHTTADGPAHNVGLRGLIVVDTPSSETADVLADSLGRDGFASLWRPRGRRMTKVAGVTGGIWDGAQLDEYELRAVAAFGASLGGTAGPVIALVDFPRREQIEATRRLGHVVVLGKPWRQEDLIDALQSRANTTGQLDEAGISARAA